MVAFRLSVDRILANAIGQSQCHSENENTYLLTFYLSPTMKVKFNFGLFAFENCDCSLLKGKAFSQNCFSIQQYRLSGFKYA